jgi:hypothetical protein
MEKFDQDAAETSVLKWWRRGGPNGSDEYSLDTISYTAHSAAVTVLLGLPQRGGLFITGSVDGTFKCWEALPTATETGASTCWQSIASGSWRSRPIQCGCAAVDGSVLALGLEGAIALFDPENGAELSTLAFLGDSADSGQATQLHCAVACDRLLLLACIHSPGGSEEIVCWDLSKLVIIARVDLRGRLPGSGAPVLRVCESQSGSTDLRLLAFRTAWEEHDDKPIEKDKQPAQICLWRWSWTKNAELEGFSSKVEIEASLPKDVEMLDACFLGGGPTQRIVGWTSGLELWELDFAKEGRRAIGREDRSDSTTLADTPSGPLARVLGDRTTSGATSTPQLLQLPLRTTLAQQAGLTAHLMQRVIPANAPSHHLPPPALIWAGVLATWGKHLEGDGPGLSAETSAEGFASSLDNAASTTQTYSEALDLPSWARKGPLPPETCRAELADATWVEQMIQDALK